MPTMTGTQYLGRVKRAPQAQGGYRFASVEPIAESAPGGGGWLSPLSDALTRFPKRGLVHWHDAPPGLREGSVWRFSVDDHPANGRDDRPEEYQLENPDEAVEVLDVRSWSDEVALRSAITADGVPLTPAPAARRILLWLASGTGIGPVLLKAGPASGLWTLDAPEAHRDAARMPAHRLTDADVCRVAIDGGRLFLAPRTALTTTTGLQNWTSDTQVARSILNRLRKMDPDLVKALGVTDTVFREYLDRVEGGKMGSIDPAVERARADRLKGIRIAIQRDADLLTEAAEVLLATEAVHEEVQRQVQSKIAEQIQARQSEIGSAVAAMTEELTRLKSEIDTTRTAKAAVENQLVDKERELEEKVGSFDQEVTARLDAIARRPEIAFADAAIIRAVMSPIAVRADVSYTDQGPRVGVCLPRYGDSKPLLENDTAVRAALAAQAGVGGLSLHAILGLHAAFLSGAAPTVFGARAYDLVRAYASTMAGGRLHWVPVGSSTMEPCDLLGRFDRTSRNIVASASGLLDVLNDATTSGRLHVVVFEGFNRAPTEGYLSPILESAQAKRAGDDVRSIALASTALLARDDPYRQLARFAWPINVLIACLPTDGSSVLPVPRSVWRFLALLDADDRDRAPMPAPAISDPGSTEISQALWKEEVADAQRLVTKENDKVSALARALSLDLRDAVDTARLSSVLSKHGMPEADATAFAVGATLLARTGVNPKAIEDGMREAAVTVIGWRSLLAEAECLRS